MNAIQKRRLAKLNYVQPEVLLSSIMPTILQPEVLNRLPKEEKKQIIEKHQAGFLSFMAKHIGGSRAKVRSAYTRKTTLIASSGHQWQDVRPPTSWPN